MVSIFRFVFAFLLLVAFPISPSQAWAQAEEGQSAHIKARLIAESATVATNGDVTIALDYTSAPGWHTYWVNPGDTGLAAKLNWSLPDHVSVGATQWPTPELLPTFGLVSYGYEGRTVLLMPLHNASPLRPGDTLPVSAKVDFLVCADVCVPESLTVSLNFKVGAPKPGPDAGTIAKAQKALPQASAIPATIAVKNNIAELGFPFPFPHPQGAYFFATQTGVLAPAAPQALDVGAKGFTLRVKAAGAALPEGPLSGVLKLADGTAYDITLSRAPLSPEVHGLGATAVTTQDKSLGGIALAMGFAFIGGLILNLMPCVFPVLSMKLLSLTRAGHDTRLARLGSLTYGLGTIVSFVALAVVLQIAQALGAGLGWGFQLQSPYVTAILSLIMLLVALNMSGVFEIGASLQGIGSGLTLAKRPLLGAFMTGVLAVVVAAPCTAPFMATAIGVALAQGGLASLAIFVALGLGFALPFVALTYLITYVPTVARALPRPGVWMDRLKQGLAVLMYAAAVWLIWVFAQQVAFLGLLVLLIALGAVTFGVLQLKLPKLVKALSLVLGLLLTGLAGSLPPADKVSSMPSGLLPHRDFHVDTLAALRAEGQPVFVDLTAAWCVTCKVNERLVLTTPEFKKALDDTGTVYMVGDWTNQDAEISHYLSLYGRSGVPLYVYYGPHNAEALVLPQMLNTAAVMKVIREGK